MPDAMRCQPDFGEFEVIRLIKMSVENNDGEFFGRDFGDNHAQ